MLKRFLHSSDFFRSVTVLMSGTVAAQAVGYLVSPIITRIYTPEDFGELGLYMRIVAFLSAVVTARFELSLMLPKNEGHAFLLYRLAIRIMMITSVIMIVFFLLYYLLFSNADDTNLLFAAITLISTVLVALINLGTNWAIRNKHFRQVSVQRFTNSISANGLKLVFGYMAMGGAGLLLATVAGYFISSFTYVRDYYRLITNKFRSYSVKKVRVLAMEYRQFPMVNLPHVLTDLGRDLLVATILVGFYSKESFGHFSLAFSMLKLPLVIIGASIGQVLYQRCSTMFNSGDKFVPLVRRTVQTLFLFSIPPFLVVFLFGDGLFSFVFGSQWMSAGVYAQKITFWLMINFILSPLASLPLIVGKAREFFFINLIGSVLQVIGFLVIPVLYNVDSGSMETSLYIVSFSQGVFMLFTIAALFRLIKDN